MSDGVGLIVPDPIILEVEPSAKVTGEGDLCDLKVENKLELPVM